MSEPSRRTVAIVGAAIAGPTLAVQMLSHPLLRARFRPVLYEQTSAPASLLPASSRGNSPSAIKDTAPPSCKPRAGASVGLFANGLFPLRQLGLADALKSRGFECGDLSLWQASLDGSHEKLHTQVNPTWSHEMQAGVMYYEWAGLREILLERVIELGGEMKWDTEVVDIQAPGAGPITLGLRGGKEEAADLLVGADGGFSKIRRFILEKRDPFTAAAKWMPGFFGMTGIYGISSIERTAEQDSTQHCIWLDRGFAATGPCPDSKYRWDLILHESSPPEYVEGASTTAPSNEGLTDITDPTEKKWADLMEPGLYLHASTLDILRAHKHVFHPIAGTFENLFSSSDRIIRTPLRQRVWEEDEIQWNNTVTIGDAARLMLPTSGQGTGFAIEDATVLANCLVKAATAEENGVGYPIQKALEEYANQRVHRSKKMARMATAAGSMSQGLTWFWKAVRYYSSKLPTSDRK
ncbi:hypothetical protein jhhlp_001867 [Lomentospora prolificans]|uniref:FAD-binding domain-containing protein n=1 Tax=Lomentospora prolificans TaxID=41688 RepID=A0A2N3NCI9_9PEZI|nr:hypothetical protein jhhlp_001867 [Lomentospora prolificans]